MSPFKQMTIMGVDRVWSIISDSYPGTHRRQWGLVAGKGHCIIV